MSCTALFFGSFNPIHIGHLIIANTILQQPGVGEVWLVVSPQNPFKTKAGLAAEADRVVMARLAVADNPGLLASDVEFSLPTPSYTYNTLQHLYHLYPQRTFAIAMGSDNLLHFEQWYRYADILENNCIYVYPRLGSQQCALAQHPNVQLVDMPLVDISSTYIRTLVAQGRSIRYMVPDAVAQYINSKQLYK